jgi:hypothetical protein
LPGAAATIRVAARTAMANDDNPPSARVRWARMRFQILGPLLAAPAVGESFLSLAQSPCPVASGTRDSTSSTMLALRPIAASDGQQSTTGDGQQLLTTRSRGHSGRPSRSTNLSRNGATSHQRCADTRSSGPRSFSASRARDLPTFGNLVTIFSPGRSSRWICL